MIIFNAFKYLSKRIRSQAGCTTAGHPVFFLFLLLILYSTGGRTEIEGEFLLFPQVSAAFRTDPAEASGFDDDDYDYGVDLFATFKFGDLIFLGEALIARHEQEVERLQLGWQAGSSKIWLGRFHNPIGYWNSQYHHGTYLQTSIDRPAIDGFEDHGGILPIHLAGLLLEGEFERGQNGWGFALAVGAGPELSDGLEAVNIRKPGAGSHDISLSLNIYYEPVPYAPTRFGAFVNHTVLPHAATGDADTRQTSGGIYGNWESEPWRLTGALHFVHNSHDLNVGTRDEGFFSGYFQAVYKLTEQWSLYGRVEWTLDEDDDLYFGYFPKYIEDRLLGGVRVDILDHHALKIEFSGNRGSRDDFGQIMLQWDAMF